MVLDAIDLYGSKVVRPLSEEGPSPIEDVLLYVPDQRDCPLPCHLDFANAHKWTLYHSVDRLRRCELPMLLRFLVLRPLNDPDTDVLIRSCTLDTDPAAAGDINVINAVSIPIDNPKNGTDLFGASLDIALACAIDGKETSAELAVTTSGGSGGSAEEMVGLLDGMRDFFDTKDNCDESVLLAYHKQTVVSIYIGPGLGKPTVASALEAVANRVQAGGDFTANRTVAQICGGDRGPATVFGLSIDTTGDFAAVQKTAASWSRGDCAVTGEDQEKLDVEIFDIASAPLEATDGGNSTTTAPFANSTSPLLTRTLNRRTNHPRSLPGLFGKRATCSYIL